MSPAEDDAPQPIEIDTDREVEVASSSDHESSIPPQSGEKPGAVQRVKDAVAGARVRVETTHSNLEAQRPHNASIDIAFCTYERDRDRGARLLAGALAYQFFFWLLPFVLVLVGCLGFLSASSASAPEDLAKSSGVVGFAAQSVSQASADSEHVRLWALLVGLPALYLASAAFVKALMIAHSLIWEIPRRKLTRKWLAALAMTGVLTATFVSIEGATAIRSRTEIGGLVAMLILGAIVGGLWLWVSLHMPRPEATTWKDLLPGVVVVAIGVQIVHLVTVYYVSRKIAGASETYGALGGAIGILLALFFLARVLVIGSELNAELWRRGQQTPNDEQPTIDGEIDLRTRSTVWHRTRQ
jgi:membrane protein